MRNRRTLFALLIAVLLAVSDAVAAISIPGAHADLPDEPGLAASTGLGESIVLVVAGRASSPADALADAAALNSRFGELQGFYVDASDNYNVGGALVQITPDAVEVECPKPGTVFEAVVESVTIDLDCPLDASAVQVLRPVGLQYVSKADYASFAFPSPCGELGQPPCQQDRYRALLGDDLSFAAGSWLLVTAFRTKQGAQEFMEFARSAGVSDLVTVQARKLGGGDVGLGQEPHPDGSGPLLDPLEDQESYQR